MIRINLLSPIDKENFKWEKANNLLLVCIVWTFLIQAFLALMFFSTREYLKAEISSVDSELESISSDEVIKEVYKIKKDLSVYSDEIDSIEDISDNVLHWSLLVDEIVTILPDGVKLKNVSSTPVVSEVNKKSDKDYEKSNLFKVDISGNALLREDLILFEENLKNSDLFSDLEFSDSNYIKSSDIDFRYSFYIDRDKLLK